MTRNSRRARTRPLRDHQEPPLPSCGFAICIECGKVGYPSKATAKQAGRLVYPGVRMRAYRCGPWWHLTSQDTATTTFYRERDERDSA